MNPNNKNVPAESLITWQLVLAGGVAAGVLFAITAFKIDTTPDKLAVLALPCVVAGAATTLAAAFLFSSNAETKACGALHELLDRHYSAAVDFLIDNPALARLAHIRQAFLPREVDFAVYSASPSRAMWLREIRDGADWIVKGNASHTGPKLTVDLETAAIAFYKNRAAKAWQERNAMAIALQRANRRLATYDRIQKEVA